jgi:serine/threonine protein kinase
VIHPRADNVSFLNLSAEVVHRDIKPSNIMCDVDMNLEAVEAQSELPTINCVLGDFSSAWDVFAQTNFYTRGPSRAEQTDEYSPPEAVFGMEYGAAVLSTAFDSWSIGIVALELVSERLAIRFKAMFCADTDTHSSTCILVATRDSQRIQYRPEDESCFDAQTRKARCFRARCTAGIILVRKMVFAMC